MRRALLVQRLTEALRLKVEHRAIAPAPSHELVVRSQLDDPALLQHADAVGETDRREAMRDEDRRTVTRLGKDALEDLGFTAHVQLRGRLVENHDARADTDGA